MSRPEGVDPEVIKGFEQLTEGRAETAVILRGLYRYYFNLKSALDPVSRIYLWGSIAEFSHQSDLPYSEDEKILAEEAQQYSDSKKETPS